MHLDHRSQRSLAAKLTLRVSRKLQRKYRVARVDRGRGF
jgi:hypothetical protein